METPHPNPPPRGERGLKSPNSTTEASYKEALDVLAQQGQLRRCRLIEPLEGALCRVEGLEAVNFSSNDYLGLARDPRLKQAAIEAIEQYGTGSSSARLICGTTPLFVE